MDIIREKKPKTRKRVIQGLVAVVALVVITGALRSLRPASPTVSRSVVILETVERGTMIRQVRGPGTLVPEQMRWITAVTSGRVERIHVLPGAEVQPGTVLMTLTNPDVEVEYLRAQQQLSDAEVQLVTLRTNLETARLTQEGNVATVLTLFNEAKRQYETNQRLFDTNPELIARDDLERSRDQMVELETRLGLERQRLAVQTGATQEQIEAQQTQIQRIRDIVESTRQRVSSMAVVAGVPGVLAEVPLQEGQWVQSGGTLARVVQTGRLKAEIRIPQTQAQDVAVGQRAFIDTRNDTIWGQVSRIDPAVQGGSVTIDVALPDELPRSARPDLSVDGTVEIARLDDVVHVARPMVAQANQRVGLFKLEPDGEHASRVFVQLGMASVNDVEIQEGLVPGDVIIASDMSQWDGFERVRLRQ